MIIGKKVILRSIEIQDVDTIRSWNFDPEVTNFFEPRLPISMQEQTNWFNAQVGSSSKKKLIICDRESNSSIGVIGLMHIDHVNKSVELGITIGDSSYLGKGFAKDAMLTIMNFLFNQFNMNQIYLTTFETNKDAIRLFEKVGFNLVAILPQRTFSNGKYVGWAYMNILKNKFTEWS
jgi:RimJ/RimL family protein N-acetyltransferase